MFAINDFQNFSGGFAGNASSSELDYLNKALTTGAYSQANGVDGRVNGAALQPESLESSLKVLTFQDTHLQFWKNIPKSQAFSTVEEFNQLLSYGDSTSGFVPEGVLPETSNSSYVRRANFVKFIGTTREVTHPMSMVRSAHGDVLALENRNGIMEVLRMVENGLFWGNSKLAPLDASGNETEGYQFDGLDKMIHPDNVVNLKGRVLQDTDINWGAEMIGGNFGLPTDMFMPYAVLSEFAQQYYPKERMLMPTPAGTTAGSVINDFQSHMGSIKFTPHRFIQRTKELSKLRVGQNAPTAPAGIALAIGTATDAEFINSGATGGTYTYAVTAVNRSGESVATASATQVLTAGDLTSGIDITITNSASMVIAPEYFRIYRSEDSGTEMYQIAQVPAASILAGGTTTFTDKNTTMPNTHTAFMGEMSQEVLEFKQLAPMMKIDLATLSPSIRWMILLYGVPVLYAPKKWMKFTNIKADSGVSNADLYA